LLTLAAALIPVMAAGAAAPAAVPPPPPRLVLVLSGGGARGAAHIGVLKVLEELHVVPDMVVGTSMGSIVGGLYAAGWKPAEIEALLVSTDWNSVFSDSVTRDQRSFRRKQDDRPEMIQTRIRFKDGGLEMPPGILGGQSLELLLSSLEMQSTAETDFDRLPIPYRAVAMDIASGDAVVIGSGSLAAAMRASMSIPAAFPPVVLDGRTLVDGGAAANLPIGIAQAIGAERVIAVDITSPLTREGEKFNSFFSVFTQLNSILTVSNRVADVGRLRDGDVLIRPALGEITFVSFDRATEAVGIGEAAAREHIASLRPFAADDAVWAGFRERHHRRPAEELVADRVRIVNTSPVSDAVVHAALGIKAGQPATDETLRPALLRLYNLEYFGVIRDRLELSPDGTRELVITVPPASTRNRVQFGLLFASDMAGDSEYAITTRHQLLAVNRLGGEWQNVLQFGTVGVAETELYQPLDAGMRWFARARAGFRREQRRLWADGEAVAEYTVDRAGLRIDAGKVLGAWGELAVGAYLTDNRSDREIGSPVLPDGSENRGAVEATLRIDTDSARAFARHGTDLRVRYTRSADWLGSDRSYEQVHGRAAISFSFGENTLRPDAEYGDNLEPVTSALSLFELGGLQHLSGLGSNELLGERVAFTRLVYFRRLKNLDQGALRLRFYAGASLEAGNVFGPSDPLTVDSLLTGWSAFLGADTPLGPFYLAYGSTDGRGRVYVTIGDRF
jgi:NTE family protein